MRITMTMLLVLCLAIAARAQTLADRVPADAMAYIGWRGTADLGANFAGSHAAAIAKESQFSQLIDQTLPALVKFVQVKEPDTAPYLESARQILTHTLRYPTAIYVAPGDPQSQGVPRFGLLCKPAKDAQTLLAEFGKIASKLPPSARAKTFTSGEIVAIVFGYPADEMALAGGDGRPAGLIDDANFKAAMAQVDADPVVTAYVNTKLVVAQIHNAMPPREREDATFIKVQKLMAELGLDAVGSAVWTGTFKNRDWNERFFVDAKERRGLLAMIDSKPLNAELLSRVPASATSMSAGRFDPQKFLAEIRRAATAVDPAWGDMVKQAMGAATLAIGVNFENEILAPLGDEWVMYCSPEVAGTDILSTVIVNKLDKPMDAKTGLASLSIFLSNTGRTFTKNQDFKLAGEMIRVEDMNVYYAALPMIAPAWTIKDGYLYMGFHPQTVVAAAKYKGAGIGEKPEYVEAMTRLEQSNVLSVKFDDVKSQLPTGYGTVRLMMRSLLGASDMFAVRTPEIILPTLPTLLREAGPAASMVWADETGLHGRSVESFPGSTTIANASITSMWMSSTALSTSILLPSLNRAREAANRIKSSSNMRMIGLACMMYANEHGDKYPDDFEDILRTQDITIDIFVSPRTATSLPAVPPGADRATIQGDWVNEHSDYIYLGRGLKSTSPANKIIAYENPVQLADGINILFADGHVEFVGFFAIDEVFKAAGVNAPAIPQR